MIKAVTKLSSGEQVALVIMNRNNMVDLSESEMARVCKSTVSPKTLEKVALRMIKESKIKVADKKEN